MQETINDNTIQAIRLLSLIALLAFVVSCAPTESSFSVQEATRARADIDVALSYISEIESFVQQLAESIEDGESKQHIVDIERRLGLITERLSGVMTLIGRESE